MTDFRSLDANREWRCAMVGTSIYTSLRTSLRDCAQAGVLEFTDLETASQAIWAAIYGLVALFIMKPHFPWVDQSRLIDTVVNSAVDSMIPKMSRMLEPVGS
jgi:hypothetical protein